jgi:hypothetical protein
MNNPNMTNLQNDGRIKIHTSPSMTLDSEAIRFNEYAAQNWPGSIPKDGTNGRLSCFLSITGGGHDIMYYREPCDDLHLAFVEKFPEFRPFFASDTGGADSPR